MKHLLIAILIAGVVGCGGKEKEEPLRMTKGDGDTSQPLVPTPEKEDTVIIQEAWYDSGRYYLHTYVKTGGWVIAKINKPPISYTTINLVGEGEIISGVTYAPYENLIKGKFKYVYESKSSEYQKAADYISSLYALDLKKARIADSVKMIEDAPTWVWNGGGDVLIPDNPPGFTISDSTITTHGSIKLNGSTSGTVKRSIDTTYSKWEFKLPMSASPDTLNTSGKGHH